MWGGLSLWFCFAFPNEQWCWTSFHVSGSHLKVSGKESTHVFYPFHNWAICFWVLSFISFFQILYPNPSWDKSLANIFSQPLKCFEFCWLFPSLSRSLFCFFFFFLPWWEYYPAVKKHGFLPFITTWLELECITPSVMSPSEKRLSYHFTYM